MAFVKTFKNTELNTSVFHIFDIILDDHVQNDLK